jgi:hypothetical protein
MNIIFKSHKAQGNVFGMSFSMIVSIILIVFFVVGAFVAIRTFLNYQKCSNIGMFLEDLQDKIDEAWYAESASYNFTSILPKGIEYVCFINLTSPIRGPNQQETRIYQDIQIGAITNFKNNFVIYAPNKNFCIKWKMIKHVDLSWKNPICLEVRSGKVKMSIVRNYSSPLVRVSA